jgi:hypothetical protein
MTADYDAVRRRLDGHRWLGGYYCECGHELNSPNGYLDHLAAVLTHVTPPGQCPHDEVTAWTGDEQTCLDCGARVTPPEETRP